MGKGKCGTCHFAPLFNGAVPPLYQKTESEVLGVPARVAWRGATVDADVGRMGFSGRPSTGTPSRTPTLRNVARTAPYMHYGVYRTLEEVVEFYDRGGRGRGSAASCPTRRAARAACT
jgi:cytochrome c peroxidase